ncbi:hypothetical protein I302_103375 [Kwoniella bestiolae CBS 10118]|uniref:Required for respiratory growth protein 9, mitochondrial n=1 Tax=Kwoniella bestiolae CBS 10118 TaxID=1296100 RepID=A0A1B9G887_9TREE|nr:hypothetical protein I302_02076 [Kwoniella bestiolae CBS 10118]OCF27236.1 hypothetical protein I302_02076 [Kwoniella bestiolae CBS 10118]
MFIITKASSSRLPPPLRHLIACAHCRPFTSTPPTLVKRPQKPYEAPLAKIDAYGNRIPIDFGRTSDKSELSRIQFLETLSERRGKSNIEKYGNSEKFGLRRGRSKGSNHIDEDGSDGGLRDQLEEEDWRNKIGIKTYNDSRTLKVGKKKFNRAMESYLEEAKRLNPNASQIQLENEMKKNQRKQKKYPGLPSQTNNRMDTRATQKKTLIRSRSRLDDEDEGTNVFVKSPKKSFGLSAITSGSGSGSRDSPVKADDPSSSTEPLTKQPKSPTEYWRPTKKLTYSAMAGLKTLHSMDPVKFNREFLSEKFGISREAVSRILKSKYRSNKESSDSDDNGLIIPGDLKGTKWDRNPASSEEISPVPAILRTFGRDQ